MSNIISIDKSSLSSLIRDINTIAGQDGSVEINDTELAQIKTRIEQEQVRTINKDCYNAVVNAPKIETTPPPIPNWSGQVQQPSYSFEMPQECVNHLYETSTILPNFDQLTKADVLRLTSALQYIVNTWPADVSGPRSNAIIEVSHDAQGAVNLEIME